VIASAAFSIYAAVGQAILALVVLVVGFFLKRKWGESDEKLAAISVNVDGRLSEAMNKIEQQGARIDQLTKALEGSNTDVPDMTRETSSR